MYTIDLQDMPKISQ